VRVASQMGGASRGGVSWRRNGAGCRFSGVLCGAEVGMRDAENWSPATKNRVTH
jgi:hypothetical protein